MRKPPFIDNLLTILCYLLTKIIRKKQKLRESNFIPKSVIREKLRMTPEIKRKSFAQLVSAHLDVYNFYRKREAYEKSERGQSFLFEEAK